MTKRKPAICGDCKSYVTQDAAQGSCARFPPQVIYAPVNPERPFVTTYPTVRNENPACGEYARA